MKDLTLNGSAPLTVADLMSNPAVAMPAQTLADNNILPAIPSTSSPEAKKEPASKSTYADTGITTTVANVQTLAETITFFGGSYTSIPLLAPANLNAMHTQATALVAAVANKKGANDIEVNSRQNQFDDVPELSTRVINAPNGIRCYKANRTRCTLLYQQA